MKCIVCIKQVPDTSGAVAVKEDGTMDRAAMATITNPDDLAAVEAALQLKDKTGCEVVVISMGPDDIVFCGRQAIDGDTAQVGPQIAEKLNLPQVSYVAGIQVEGKTVTVKRLLEDGYMTLRVQTPCLLTCVKELNEPRHMRVGGIMECFRMPLDVYDYPALKDDELIDVDVIGLNGSPTNVYKSFSPPKRNVGMIMDGAGSAACGKLISILTEKHLI